MSESYRLRYHLISMEYLIDYFFAIVLDIISGDFEWLKPINVPSLRYKLS